MTKETIDESKKDFFKSDPFILIGVGAFFWLCISGYGYLFELIIKDVLILSNMEHQIIFFGIHFGRFFLLVILIWLTLNKFERIIKSSSKSANYLFRITIITFAISQGLQFFYTFYFYDYIGIDYFDLASSYYSSSNEMHMYNTILDVVLSTCLYIIVGGILYSKSKKMRSI